MRSNSLDSGKHSQRSLLTIERVARLYVLGGREAISPGYLSESRFVVAKSQSGSSPRRSSLLSIVFNKGFDSESAFHTGDVKNSKNVCIRMQDYTKQKVDRLDITGLSKSDYGFHAF